MPNYHLGARGRCLLGGAGDFWRYLRAPATGFASPVPPRGEHEQAARLRCGPQWGYPPRFGPIGIYLYLPISGGPNESAEMSVCDVATGDGRWRRKRARFQYYVEEADFFGEYPYLPTRGAP